MGPHLAEGLRTTALEKPGKEWIVNPLLMLFSPFPHYFLSLRSNILLITVNQCTWLTVTDQVSYTCFFFFGSLFHDTFSVTRLYSINDRVTSQWRWTHKDKHPCLKWDSNPRSQCPSDQGLHLRPHGHWDRHIHTEQVHPAFMTFSQPTTNHNYKNNVYNAHNLYNKTVYNKK
jgi:hypothetical protein